MNTKTARQTNQRLFVMLLGLTALTIVIFVLVDQSIALAMVIGIVLAILMRLSTGIPGPKLRVVARVFIGVAMVVFIVIAILPRLGAKLTEEVFGPIISGLGGSGVGEWPPCEEIQITANDLKSGEFDVIQEQVTESYIGRQSGLILKELSFHTLEDFRCTADSDDPMTIDLVDFPQNVFFDARGASNVTRTTYLNTETISWQQTTSQITFSYVPPGLRFLKQPLAFFYGIGSVGEAVMSVLGFVGTFAVSAIIQPTFEDMLRERLKKWLQSSQKHKDDAKVVSDTTSNEAEAEPEAN